jgi:hypothetical protein|tara:strand:+ start:705 stop:1172 length:468 start_codon:yes stop_codon:yes gene_type:complete
MRIFLILATLSLTPITYAATGCILDMNGSWSLNPEKSLDPTNLVYEVLVFSNTAKEQRYLMKFENGPNDRGSLEWSVPCDGQDHPSPDFPWSTAPNATVAITRLGDKSEFVVQKEDGELTTTYTRILADDDQTMISIGRNANQKVVWVRVFDKED